ncbi:MAG TPA: guanylate kinase, partial [Thiobacillaceae bacterium]
ERDLDEGRDILLEIDWQGAAQVKAHFQQSASIFILPPSFNALRIRLAGRGQDSEEVIERRLAAAAHDVAHAGEFDYIIVNDDFDHALEDLVAITRSIRHEAARQLDRYAALFDEFRRI